MGTITVVVSVSHNFKTQKNNGNYNIFKSVL